MKLLALVAACTLLATGCTTRTEAPAPQPACCKSVYEWPLRKDEPRYIDV